MNRRYPSVRITPADVTAFFQARFQQPSTEDTERWLSSHKRSIEEMMGLAIQKNLERILEEATLMAYPDPVFDTQFREIDEAIQAISDEYANGMRLEQHSSSYEELDMLEVVARMVSQRRKFKACMDYSQEFSKPSNGSGDGEIVHRTKRIHLTRSGGRVATEVVKEDTCRHGPEVFVPQRRESSLGNGPADHL